MDTGKVVIEKINCKNCLIWSAQLEALLQAKVEKDPKQMGTSYRQHKSLNVRLHSTNYAKDAIRREKFDEEDKKFALLNRLRLEYTMKKTILQNEAYIAFKEMKYKPELQPKAETTQKLKNLKLLDGSSAQRAKYEYLFAFITASRSKIDWKWFFDCCASRHVTNQKEIIVDYPKLNGDKYICSAAE
eukprot:IDg21218t1